MTALSSMLLLIVSTFVFAVYIMVMVQIIADVFRDPSLGTAARVVWILGLLFVPVVTAVLYLASRGQGISRRASAARARTDAETRRGDSVSSRAIDVIAEARSMRDAGVLTQDEFETLKHNALAQEGGRPPAHT